jgi:glyoxylase-like metal-dependent hydrolase (beta-lactamase superfamily II)
MGWGFKLTKWFWLKHFTFVKDESLAGARELEQTYKQAGELRAGNLPPKSYVGFIVAALLLLLVVLGLAGTLVWMYFSFARQTHAALAPNVYAVLDGGGNSLLVHNAGEAVLVDPKFGPGASTLRKWIDKDLRLRVTTVVNTHHHYDHTRGNALYPGARFVAYRTVPQSLCQRPKDAEWCAKYPFAIPGEFVNESNRDSARAKRLFIGETELLLFHPGIAHTHDDVCVFLPKYNIVATGDLLFFGYYPFIDTTPASGASLPGTVAALRKLAGAFPDATFVPGHGPLARAADLRLYADYLEDLDTQVRRAYAAGQSEDEAARSVDLRRWDRKILPSFPDDRLIPEWATADRNIRSAYQLAKGS